MLPTVRAVHDLSVPVADGDVTWCLAPNVKMSRRRIIGDRDEMVNAEDLHAPVHFGTHIDFPFHMIADGKTCDDYPPSDFIGRGVFIDLEGIAPRTRIMPEHVKDHDIRPGDVVFLNLGWWRHRGHNDTYLYEFPGLGTEVAQYFAERGVRGVGSDAYCIEHVEEGHLHGPFPAHIALNEKDIWIIEGLDDISVGFGRDDLMVAAFPIKLAGVGGSPARVVAIEFESGS